MISHHIIDTLNDDHIQILAENGCDFACSNGIVMKDNYSLPVNVSIMNVIKKKLNLKLNRYLVLFIFWLSTLYYNFILRCLL